MGYDPHKHHRRSTRLPEYDYSQPGAYFVTVCASRRGNIFGALDGPRVGLNACGALVRDWWLEVPRHFAQVDLDEFLVMPDHLHAVIWLRELHEGQPPLAPLGSIVAFWKHKTTGAVNLWRAERHGAEWVKVWQRGFFDHIVRDEAELHAIRGYIRDNPLRASLRQDM